MTRKYTFRSREEAENAAKVLSSESLVSSMCLTAILNGEPSQTFRKGDYSVRVLRPMACHGGLVIVTYRSSCCRQSDQHRTAYLSDWCQEREQSQFNDKDATDCRWLAEQARRYVTECYRAERQQTEACQELLRIGA